MTNRAVRVHVRSDIYKGRKPIERFDFGHVVSLWRNGSITAVEAMRRLDMSPSTFYRKVRREVKT